MLLAWRRPPVAGAKEGDGVRLGAPDALDVQSLKEAEVEIRRSLCRNDDLERRLGARRGPLRAAPSASAASSASRRQLDAGWPAPLCCPREATGTSPCRASPSRIGSATCSTAPSFGTCSTVYVRKRSCGTSSLSAKAWFSAGAMVIIRQADGLTSSVS